MLNGEQREKLKDQGGKIEDLQGDQLGDQLEDLQGDLQEDQLGNLQEDQLGNLEGDLEGDQLEDLQEILKRVACEKKKKTGKQTEEQFLYFEEYEELVKAYKDNDDDAHQTEHIVHTTQTATEDIDSNVHQSETVVEEVIDSVSPTLHAMTQY